MATCAETYTAAIKVCDETYAAAKLACKEDPVCLISAINARRACENAATLEYIICIGSVPPANKPSVGSPVCGCGG